MTGLGRAPVAFQAATAAAVQTRTDGPYGETKELFGGFFLLDVASKQEAVEWAKRVPSVPGSKIEIRRVPGEDEVPQDNGKFVKEGALRESSGQI